MAKAFDGWREHTPNRLWAQCQVPAAGRPVGLLMLEGTPVAWASVGVTWVIAVLLLARMRGARLG